MTDRFLLRPLKWVAKAATNFGTGVFSVRVRTRSGGEDRPTEAADRSLTDEIEQRQGVDVRRLNGLLPICAYCHAIRDDSSCWRRFEEYLTDRLAVTFTHGICPKCQDKVEQGIAREDPPGA